MDFDVTVTGINELGGDEIVTYLEIFKESMLDAIQNVLNNIEKEESFTYGADGKKVIYKQFAQITKVEALPHT